jgi:hypothetical protein
MLLSLSACHQRGDSSIHVQLLQTLSILIENLTSKSSLYYLLSNDRINAIISHQFDFGDEEVLAYYISFLKVRVLCRLWLWFGFVRATECHCRPCHSSWMQALCNSSSTNARKSSRCILKPLSSSPTPSLWYG